MITLRIIEVIDILIRFNLLSDIYKPHNLTLEYEEFHIENKKSLKRF